ncbi:MAG: hypothetical protein ACREU6_14545 [Steroidobacteraceae bacterium]
MLKRRFRLVLAFAVLAAGPGAGLADDIHKPADPVLDDELLEFLGSVDPASDAVQPDDGRWIEYLSQTDIGKVAKPGDPTVIAAKPAAPAPQPSAPGAKQDE